MSRLGLAALLVVVCVACADYVGDDLRAGDYPRRDLINFDQAAALATDTHEARTPEPVDPRILQVGDCFDDLDGPPVRGVQWGREVDRVPCELPHRYEVYARPALGDPAVEPFPGGSQADERADLECVEAFETFVGTSWSSSELDFVTLVPDRARWEAGDTVASCALFDLGLAPLVGSARGAAR